MELRYYFDILWRRLATIIIVTSLTVTVATAAGIFTTPMYAAGATVRVVQDVGITDLGIRESYGERLMNTYSRVLVSRPILEIAAKRLTELSLQRGTASDEASLSLPSTSMMREKLTIEVIPETELIRIAVKDQDPVLARDLTNILAALLVEYAQSLYQGDADSISPIIERELSVSGVSLSSDIIAAKSTRQILQEQLAALEQDMEDDRQQLETLLEEDRTSEAELLARQINFKEDSYDRLLDRYELARLNETLRAKSITITEAASLPTVPINGMGLGKVGLSFVVGLFGGVGLAFVLENLDTRIHSSHQLERLTQLPMLGAVPRGQLYVDDYGNIDSKGNNGSLGEAYRLVGINLQLLKEGNAFKTILITSTTLREDKSTVVANLAQVLAERGQAVFIVESDLRHPVITELLGIELEDDSLGLSNLLTERSLEANLLSQMTYPAKQPSLFVIGSGQKVSNSTALLASPPMEKLISYLRAQGQMTLLDAPPVLGLADVSVLAPMVDGVVLVVKQAQTKREQLFAAIRQLEASRAHVLGFIFVQKNGKGWRY